MHGSRLNVFAALGLRDGDAHVLRNAGGVVTDDVIRSLAISQRLLGTRAIVLIHHTDCGMQKLTDDGFRAELQEATGVAPEFAIESFKDVDANVRQSILRVARSPFLLHRENVRGFVYDVDTHRLREVVYDSGLTGSCGLDRLGRLDRVAILLRGSRRLFELATALGGSRVLLRLLALALFLERRARVRA